MNKKAQIEQGSNPFGRAHPVLVVGIFIFVLPYLGVAIGWNIPGWITGVGTLVILAGVVLSIMRDA